jgi:hypothetical protein
MIIMETVEKTVTSISGKRGSLYVVLSGAFLKTKPKAPPNDI